VDLELLWRVLTYSERRRFITRVADSGQPPRHWQWDLTSEGQTQVSILGMLTKRAKYGGILGLAAAVAALLGADATKVTAIVFGGLIAFAVLLCAVYATYRWSTPYAVPAIKEREAQIQDERVKAGAQPWWPRLE
jgi:hypothetical protein